MKKLALLTVLAALLLPVATAGASFNTTLRNVVANNGTEIDISVKTIDYYGKTYISLDDVLKGCGYQAGWNEHHGAVVVYNPTIDTNMYIYVNGNRIWDGERFHYYGEPFLNDNGAAYVTLQMIKDLIGRDFKIDLNYQSFFTGISQIVDETDKYRRKGKVQSYNGINLLDEYYAFESVIINENMTSDYASVVNQVASVLPPEVNVYCMPIHNSSEFYAPKEYSTDLKTQYERIFANLSDRVIPVNIFSALFNNADDFIFFNSDHHWTQRGAYYAFEEFMKVRGTPLYSNYLKMFRQSNSENVVGSFAGLMKETEGQAMLSKHGELLERFIPPFEITKNIYNDCKMEDYVASGPLILENYLAYGTFLGGDVPVVELHNTVKNDGSSLCIIKDSYANAFATWAACNYEYVYLVDIRCFNGAHGFDQPFDIMTFHAKTGFRDLLIMSYPNTIGDYVLRDYIRKMAG